MPTPVYLNYKQPNKPGRPTLLTKELQAKLLSAIEEGLPLKQAAEQAGICYETMNRWRIRGEDETAPIKFRQFCQSLRRSQAVAMQVYVSCIRKASNNDWRAAAWMLERRHPEEFTKPQQIEHSVPNGAPIVPTATVNYEVLTRIKKQNGIVDLMGKLGVILAKHKQQAELVKLESNLQNLAGSFWKLALNLLAPGNSDKSRAYFDFTGGFARGSG